MADHSPMAIASINNNGGKPETSADEGREKKKEKRSQAGEKARGESTSVSQGRSGRHKKRLPSLPNSKSPPRSSNSDAAAEAVRSGSPVPNDRSGGGTGGQAARRPSKVWGAGVRSAGQFSASLMMKSHAHARTHKHTHARARAYTCSKRAVALARIQAYSHLDDITQ